ncbi:peptide-methionine (R)-S-oxide reductase MsrB [Tumidithrix elongata RA019]|uniref:peptide-methionine (R)-S-oxide reductase n=1 Tax=Tumidithrix elongata BACA0141 TaxID=2716417 RepID=A0AAW9Q4X1_9CYAN|nr:peptide-methionine (R)-S-oxide reductase MsrB [Tumidithrix elongata RA019]
MKKRTFLLAGTAAVSVVLLSRFQSNNSETQNSENIGTAVAADKFEIMKTEEEWKQLLTPEQFRVLRKHGTERSHTSPLDKEYGKGTFVCAGCDLPLFSSTTKFDSGTGWPSFYAPLDGAIGTTVDRSLFMTRTEVHCKRCGGHLGHVFNDGPNPTGLRYCMNGVSLKFIPS